MCFKTIMSFTRPLLEAYFFNNYLFMVDFTTVRRSLLARLATVLVWQRAVNRQPGYRSGNSKGRSPSRSCFSENLKFSKKSPQFSTFAKVRDG